MQISRDHVKLNMAYRNYWDDEDQTWMHELKWHLPGLDLDDGWCYQTNHLDNIFSKDLSDFILKEVMMFKESIQTDIPND